MKRVGEVGVLKALSDGVERTTNEIAQVIDCERKLADYHLIRKEKYTPLKRSLVERGLVEVTNEIKTVLGGYEKVIRQYKITKEGLKSLRESGEAP